MPPSESGAPEPACSRIEDARSHGEPECAQIEDARSQGEPECAQIERERSHGGHAHSRIDHEHSPIQYDAVLRSIRAGVGPFRALLASIRAVPTTVRHQRALPANGNATVPNRTWSSTCARRSVSGVPRSDTSCIAADSRTQLPSAHALQANPSVLLTDTNCAAADSRALVPSANALQANPSVPLPDPNRDLADFRRPAPTMRAVQGSACVFPPDANRNAAGSHAGIPWSGWYAPRPRDHCAG
jgi:hypothetical protein